MQRSEQLNQRNPRFGVLRNNDNRSKIRFGSNRLLKRPIHAFFNPKSKSVIFAFHFSNTLCLKNGGTSQ